MNVDRLKQLQLHDQSLDSICFDFTKDEVNIFLTIDSEIGDQTYDLCFKKITDIKVLNLQVNNMQSLEISSVEHSVVNHLNHIKFILLQGPSMPSSEVSFLYAIVS